MGQRVQNKIAIVTGASTGIGSATARLFIAEGAKVLAADIKEPGEELAAALAEKSTSLRFETLDVRSEAAWAQGLQA